MTDFYWKALEPYDDKQCAGAFNRAISECKFMPKPADLIEFMGKPIAVEDRALVIANDILSHLQTYGAGKFPDLKGDEVAINLMTTRWPDVGSPTSSARG